MCFLSVGAMKGFVSAPQVRSSSWCPQKQGRFCSESRARNKRFCNRADASIMPLKLRHVLEVVMIARILCRCIPASSPDQGNCMRMCSKRSKLFNALEAADSVASSERKLAVSVGRRLRSGSGAITLLRRRDSSLRILDDISLRASSAAVWPRLIDTFEMRRRFPLQAFS